MSEVTIQRIRLRASRPNARFPWRFAYVVPREAYPHLYSMFGLCLSHAVPRALCQDDPSSYYTFHIDHMLVDGREVEREARVRPAFNPGDLLVIPLKRAARSGRLEKDLAHARVIRDEHKHPLISDSRARHLKLLSEAVPADTATVHLGPKPEDAQPLCGLCSQLEARLMGDCTPGSSRCSYSLRLPAPHPFRKERA